MTKKQIPLKVLKSAEKDGVSWENGATYANLEVEDNKVVIPIKIKKVGNDNWSKNKWERNFQLFSTYTIEPLEFTFLDKIIHYRENNNRHTIFLSKEGKKIEVSSFMITYKNLKSEIPNLEEIFHEGAEVKLRLGGRWFLRDENDNDNYSLEVYHDYEIIKSDGTVISFPELTSEDRNNEESQNKWNSGPERGSKSRNYKSAQEHLNNLYIFKDKKEVKSINLEDQELKGSLDLNDFPNLELLSLKNNQISEVDVSNCRKLKHLDLTDNNNLTKLIVYDLNFFERLIADTGTLKKSTFFGGKSEWEPDNVGNPNIAPLKITEKKEDAYFWLNMFLVPNWAPKDFRDNYYLFSKIGNSNIVDQILKESIIINKNHREIKKYDGLGLKHGPESKYSIKFQEKKQIYEVDDRLEIIDERKQKQKNPNEGILKALVLNNISVKSILENNPQYAGAVENANWSGISQTINLNRQEFNQVKQDIIHKIIAKNPTDWEIREEKITEWSLTDNKITLLIHKPTGLKRKTDGSIEIECGKVHFKKGFTEKEWKEIEKIISENNRSLNSSENKNRLEKVINSPWTWLIIVGLLIVLIVGMWIKRKVF